MTGYKFRPVHENPYLAVRTDDGSEELEEFGLDADDGEVEMSTRQQGAGELRVGEVMHHGKLC